MVEFQIEETNTGYSAFYEHKKGVVATTGSNIEELKDNAVESYNLFASYQGFEEITKEDIVFIEYET